MSTGTDPTGDGDAAETGSDDGPGPLGTWPRKVGVTLVALVGVVVLLYLLGVIGVPEAGIEDEGDWGEVTEERTEIVTTVWVNNPNPVGVSLGETVTADYGIHMNGVRVAEGSKSDIDVPPGNSTEKIRTDLINDRLSAWWVAFVRADETVYLDANATITVDTVRTFEHSVNRSREMLTDETPIRDTLSAAVNRTSDEYTRTVEADAVDDGALDGPLGGSGDASVTVGYEIKRGWATWGPVDDEETTVRFHMLVHNPGDVPVPAAPEGVGVSVAMNDVDLFEGETDEFETAAVGTDAVIRPNETREVTVEVRMDNERIDEWFPRHVDDYEDTTAEETAIEAQFQVVFSDPATGTTFRIPEDSPATYDCDFRTAILVDNGTAGSTCAGPDAPAGR